MQQITMKMLDQQRLFISALLGMQIELQTGSKTNGIAYRLYVKGPNGSHGRCPGGIDYLGMTKREAFNSLCHIRRGMEAMSEMMRSGALQGA